MPTRKRRVFVAFDFDNDKFLKDAIIGQAKNDDSPFEVTDMSMKEAAKEDEWLAQAKARIKRSDSVVVMLGEKTYKASGVLKEVKAANDMSKNMFQVIGYPDKTCPSVPDAGTRYEWTWPNLKALLPKITTT